MFLAGLLGCWHTVISPPLPPQGLSLPHTPQQDGGSVPTPWLQCRLLCCLPKLLAEKILWLALCVAERLPVPWALSFTPLGTGSPRVDGSLRAGPGMSPSLPALGSGGEL